MMVPNKLQELRAAFDAEAFGRSYGLRSDEAAASKFTSNLTIAAQHQIEEGTFVHGGCLAALCEQTNRYAARSGTRGDAPMSTTELQMSFLAGAAGQQLVCRASVVAVAKHGFIVDSSICSAGSENKPVAISRSTVAVLADTGTSVGVHALAGNDPLVRAPLPFDTAWKRWIREDFDHGWRRYCGIRPSNAGHGWVEMSHEVDIHHVDKDGFVLPGLIAPFADATGGACAYSTGGVDERMATLDLTLSYLNTRSRPRALSGRGRAIKIGKTVVVSRVDIFGVTSGGEELVATALVTVTRVPGHERALLGSRAALATAHPAKVHLPT